MKKLITLALIGLLICGEAEARILNPDNVQGGVAAALITGILSLLHGGTSSDLSQTGGPGQVLKQLGPGAPVTVGTLNYSDLTGAPPPLQDNCASGQLLWNDPANPSQIGCLNIGAGLSTTTTNGQTYLIVLGQGTIPANALLDQSGLPLLDQSGNVLLEQ